MGYDIFKPALGVAAALAVLAMPAQAQTTNPYMEPDDSWIDIQGEVGRVWKDAFTLDYGDGQITVEMDDGDRDADAYVLRPGDKVSVAGRVDDDLFEVATIEAASVYVENLGTTFYSSAVDEEDWLVSVDPPLETSSTLLRGTVTSVGDDSFDMRVGSREVTVYTREMEYDPLDDEGYQRIGRGDFVAVSARLQADFFEGHRVVADHITTIHDRTLNRGR